MKTKRVSKIQDTVYNFGQAEAYIAFSAGFEKFLGVQGLKVDEVKKVNALNIVKKFKLKGVVFGNYVTQEERYYFLYKISKQLEFLAKIKGNNNLGHNNLIVAFGVEGKAKSNAHYNPAKALINLNRGRKGNYDTILKGENSFIHEYGHYIDFVAGRKNKSLPFNFASEAEKGFSSLKSFYEPVNILVNDRSYMRNIEKSEYLSKRIEIFARTFEASVTIMAQVDRSYKRFFDLKKYANPIYPKKGAVTNSINSYILQCLRRDIK